MKKALDRPGIRALRCIEDDHNVRQACRKVREAVHLRVDGQVAPQLGEHGLREPRGAALCHERDAPGWPVSRGITVLLDDDVVPTAGFGGNEHDIRRKTGHRSRGDAPQACR